MMPSWVDEGVAERTAWGHPCPVVHLIIVERRELWCSGGRGRVASVGSGTGTGGGRPCPRCAALARQAVYEETLDPGDVPRFIPTY
jgi:hypothetical protein